MPLVVFVLTLILGSPLKACVMAPNETAAEIFLPNDLVLSFISRITRLLYELEEYLFIYYSNQLLQIKLSVFYSLINRQVNIPLKKDCWKKMTR